MPSSCLQGVHWFEELLQRVAEQQLLAVDDQRQRLQAHLDTVRDSKEWWRFMAILMVVTCVAQWLVNIGVQRNPQALP